MKDNSQSVILNLNKNYSNNKAFDFSTIVNKTLGIAPNTDVALYCGNIVRKPIVLPNTTRLTVNLNSIVDERMKTLENDGAVFLTPLNDLTNIDIEAGEYSKSTFSKACVETVNTDMAAFDYVEDTKIALTGSDQPILKALPYRFHSSLNDTYYLGMRYKLPAQQEQEIPLSDSNLFDPNWHLTSILDLDDGMTTSKRRS